MSQQNFSSQYLSLYASYSQNFLPWERHGALAVDGLLSWAVELSPPMSASILRFFPRFAGLIVGHTNLHSGSSVGEKLCLDISRVLSLLGFSFPLSMCLLLLSVMAGPDRSATFALWKWRHCSRRHFSRSVSEIDVIDYQNRKGGGGVGGR